MIFFFLLESLVKRDRKRSQKNSYLVAKHFDLAIAAMRGWCVRVSMRRWVFVCVHLDMQRQSFHAFLTGEVGA